MIIDDKLFIHRPTGIEKSKTPVCDFLLKNEEKAQKWTGLDAYDRDLIYEHLGEAKFQLKILHMDYTSGDMRALSVPCQFLLTLAILRKGFDYGEFAHILDVGKSTVTKVFKTWIYFMYSVFGHPEWRKTLAVKTVDLPPPPKCFDNKWLGLGGPRHPNRAPDVVVLQYFFFY